MTRTEKNKKIHDYLEEENEQHKLRLEQNKASLNDIFVELMAIEARHAPKTQGQVKTLPFIESAAHSFKK